MVELTVVVESTPSGGHRITVPGLVLESDQPVGATNINTGRQKAIELLLKAASKLQGEADQ